MKPFVRGISLAVAQTLLVASVGAKLLYDRATRPRVWVLTAPYDPSLPIRGRYVSLQLAVEPRAVKENKPGAARQPSPAVELRVEDQRLVAHAASREHDYSGTDLHVRFIQINGEKIAVLDQPVAFFIPEHIADPSRRPAGEELWVEVTIPDKGPPRPIRLGVRKGDGPIMPLEIN